ncbi:MAG: hypothetical protein QNL18_13295 [Pseudomonadales bacterium]|jgi:hypothetical protein
MSDRWQYVVGGIISLVLAMGYLTLTSGAPSVAPDQSTDQLSLDAAPGVSEKAASSDSPPGSPSSTRPEARSAPETGHPNREPGLNQKNGLSVVLAPPAAPIPAALAPPLSQKPNSESPAPDSTTGP